MIYVVPGGFVLFFNKSTMYCLLQIVYIPIVIYVPSLAFNQGKYPDTCIYVDYVHMPIFPRFPDYNIFENLGRLFIVRNPLLLSRKQLILLSQQLRNIEYQLTEKKE